MRSVCYEPDAVFDQLFQVLDTPLPSSPMTDPTYFLNANEAAIMRGLNDSRREQRRIARVRYAAAFGVFTAIAMMLTFSREVRAFAHDVIYSVIEWFSPEKNESGVSFEIDNKTHSGAPGASALQPDEKVSFEGLNEAVQLYNHSIYTLNSSSFALTDGYVQDDTICINFNTNGTRVQLITAPIGRGDSVNFHFNGDSFEKTDATSVGTFYYDLSGGNLFGGILTNDTSIIVRVPENASAELLEKIVQALSLYR